MNITTAIDGAKAKLDVEGRIAVDTAGELNEAIVSLPESVCDIEVDLSNTTYVSSAGLRVFVSGNKLAKSRGGSFCVSHPIGEVMDVLTMTGITDLINVID
ncbi:MAG: STAS domain-containing protein [Coriobacteriales bacterium]|nr:STAS domain-containing protein [Coriobacteriales bacterium]